MDQTDSGRRLAGLCAIGTCIAVATATGWVMFELLDGTYGRTVSECFAGIFSVVLCAVLVLVVAVTPSRSRSSGRGPAYRPSPAGLVPGVDVDEPTPTGRVRGVRPIRQAPARFAIRRKGAMS